IDRMIAAQPAAVGVERQFTNARDEIAVGNELAALALFAEAEVFELHEHGNGEAVIDGGVFDVLRRDAGFLERFRSGPHPGGIGEIERMTTARSFKRLTMPDYPHQWLFQALCDRLRGHNQPAAAIG